MMISMQWQFLFPYVKADIYAISILMKKNNNKWNCGINNNMFLLIQNTVIHTTFDYEEHHKEITILILNYLTNIWMMVVILLQCISKVFNVIFCYVSCFITSPSRFVSLASRLFILWSNFFISASKAFREFREFAWNRMNQMFLIHITSKNKKWIITRKKHQNFMYLP